MDLKAKLGLHLKKKTERSTKNQLHDQPSIDCCHLSSLLPGRVTQTEFGEYFLVEYRYPLAHLHGKIHLGAIEHTDLAALTGVLKSPDLPSPERLGNFVFVDTETTGLAGGTGTYAFLVGIGYFQDAQFVLRQYLMEDYHQELAMLQALSADLAQFSHLVTFNGKSFDWPLLMSRFIFHRMRDICEPVQVDLLHPARRYYKRRLTSCSLGSLEGEVLGFYRENDISGAEVPSLFFRYLEERDGQVLLPVLQHNHWDILSLVSLITHLLETYLKPLEVLEAAEDLFSAGKIYEDLGAHDQAIQCYCHSLNKQRSPVLANEILTKLSFLYKRLGKLEEACDIWRGLAEKKRRHLPFIELAKYYEHTTKEFIKALEMTRQAKGLLLEQRRRYTSRKFQELLGAIGHREARLLKKLGVQERQTQDHQLNNRLFSNSLDKNLIR